ncbi:hypothetical protein F3D3_3474 [Fusibacter sp. 3D3]|nr:hypothetical protein F3D3_3474 [Fusibacter sp. 3D3]
MLTKQQNTSVNFKNFFILSFSFFQIDLDKHFFSLSINVIILSKNGHLWPSFA